MIWETPKDFVFNSVLQLTQTGIQFYIHIFQLTLYFSGKYFRLGKFIKEWGLFYFHSLTLGNIADLAFSWLADRHLLCLHTAVKENAMRASTETFCGDTKVVIYFCLLSSTLTFVPWVPNRRNSIKWCSARNSFSPQVSLWMIKGSYISWCEISFIYHVYHIGKNSCFLEIFLSLGL